ncbi:MAG: methyltransferase domain-containing protein [Patescibacteria group bacterium]
MSNVDPVTLKKDIQEHYDLVTPYYNSLWGKHIHHGYWISGKETKEVAQVNLVKKLIEVGEIKPNRDVLDVGCGVGASSIYLAEHLGERVTGIIISPIQVDIAKKFAADSNVKVKFLVMDAEKMMFSEKFDYVWSIEAISHFPNKDKFFKDAILFLNPGGRIALVDWFKKEGLSSQEDKRYIDPIRKGMLVPDISTMQRYEEILIKNGCKVITRGDISVETAKTWDISLDIIKNPKFWDLAIKHGRQFVDFLKSFQAMRAGFSSKSFIYGYIIAEKATLDV